MPLHSYPSIYALGHKAIEQLFSGPVLIQEKVDGSQFSMGRTESGELECRSKGQQLIVSAPEKMFQKAVDTAQSLDLHPGWVYRCEYLSVPKHNTLAYSRVPNKYLIVYDICPGLETYLSYDEMVIEATRLGLEVVPRLYEGMVDNIEMFKGLLERESVLGGVQIEGVVAKNYALFTTEKKVAMGKFVSESFKEKHGSDWKERNPGQGDFVQTLIGQYRTDARWQKAVQHLRESGKLEGSPRDIGLLVREVPEDILKECEQEIKDALFDHFWKDIQRGVIAGLPQWYKDQLAQTAFGAKE